VHARVLPAARGVFLTEQPVLLDGVEAVVAPAHREDLAAEHLVGIEEAAVVLDAVYGCAVVRVFQDVLEHEEVVGVDPEGDGGRARLQLLGVEVGQCAFLGVEPLRDHRVGHGRVIVEGRHQPATVQLLLDEMRVEDFLIGRVELFEIRGFVSWRCGWQQGGNHQGDGSDQGTHGQSHCKVNSVR